MPFRFDNYATDLTPATDWKPGDPWELHYAQPGLDDRDQQIEDALSSFDRLPRGLIGLTFTAVDQLAIGAGPSNMANFDLTFTAAANRRYKFTSVVHLVPSAASVWYVQLLDGATDLGRMAQHSLGNVGMRLTGVMVTPTALVPGVRTMHMSINRGAGAGTCDSVAAGLNSFLMVEDMGSF